MGNLFIKIISGDVKVNSSRGGVEQQTVLG